MEPTIRHVRFFNGQFLRQDEFNEEQSYLNHMRRRLNYALFTDGVVQITPNDLLIRRGASTDLTPPTNPADKRVHVTPGMAIGANQNLLESREVILRDFTTVTDLSTLFAGGTVWVTVSFRRTEAVPVAVGSTTENSRVDETADIRFHNANPAGTLTADGDPLIVLGSIDFATMTFPPGAGGRQTAILRSALFAPAPTVSISPTTVTQGQTAVTMTLTAGGSLDLTSLVASGISFLTPGGPAPAGDFTGLTIVGTPTAVSATIRFNVSATAGTGAHSIGVTAGSNSATSNSFTVQTFVPAPTVNPTGFPGSIAINALLTINGTNLNNSPSVRFNTNLSAIVKSTFTQPGESVSATQIVLRVPPGTAGNGTLTVTTTGGTATTPTINIV